MALSRPLKASVLVDSSSKPTFCRFCGTKAVARTFVNLQSNETSYKSALNKLQYMNIKPAKKLHMNICHPCYRSFNNAYNFCQKFNRSQMLLANIARRDINNAAKARKRPLDKNNKKEPVSCDEIDIEDEGPVPIYNKKKKEFVDLGKTWSSYDWTCCHCDASFEGLAELRTHSKRKHGICYAFECPDCDIKLNKYNHFIDHVRKHKENLRFFCEVCDKLLPLDGCHHGAGKESCSSCGEIFPDKESLVKHLQLYKKRAVTPRDKENGFYIITVPDLQLEDAQPVCDAFQSWEDYVWACAGCDIKFHSVAAIRAHSEEVHNCCFNMKCVDCGAMTDVYHKMCLHIMRHRPSLRHFCPFCDRLAHNDNGFREHVRVHLTNTSYCPECGQIYDRISAQDAPSMTTVLWFLEPPGTTVDLQERRPDQSFANENEETRDNEEEESDSSNGNSDSGEEGDSEGESSSSSSGADESDDEESENDDESEATVEEEENGNVQETGDGAEYLQRLESLVRDADPFGAEYALPCPTACRYCTETFTDKRLYKEHTQTRYCLICDRVYNCSKLQEEHLFSDHLADKPFECYKCGRCYRIRGNAFACMQKHLVEETSLCKICNSMVLTSFLAEHAQAHKYEISRKEKVCGLGFCREKFSSWMELVKHRHSKHLAITCRKVRTNGRYLALQNIGILPKDN